MIDLANVVGFDWDDGNRTKSILKHGVELKEAEEIFSNEPLLILSDARHSAAEQRYHAMGRTNAGRLLLAAFTLRDRDTMIRIISVRSMKAREGGSMKKKLKPIPRFANEDEERKFWLTHDTTDYLDWSTARRVKFPNLKPSTKSISLRLPVGLLEDIKIEANKRDVPYQSLIKIWLAEKVS